MTVSHRCDLFTVVRLPLWSRLDSVIVVTGKGFEIV